MSKKVSYPEVFNVDLPVPVPSPQPRATWLIKGSKMQVFLAPLIKFDIYQVIRPPWHGVELPDYLLSTYSPRTPPPPRDRMPICHTDRPGGQINLARKPFNPL